MNFSSRIFHYLYRDIKPDNMLLDGEGHVHLTDFNVAIELHEGELATSLSGTKPYMGHVHLTDFNVAIELHDGELATSLSGTKPYMAPEMFACAVDAVPGYSFPVDWWSLGVAAYEVSVVVEVRKGRRPYDIHAGTPVGDVRRLLGAAPRYPRDWGASLVALLDKLLTPAPGARLCSLARALRLCGPAGDAAGGAAGGGSRYTEESLLNKQHQPPFVPPKDHLNCDPTFELEEMIIESRPLHKKKKRLSKQRSLLQTQSSLSVANLHGEVTRHSLTSFVSPSDEVLDQFFLCTTQMPDCTYCT
ncbi:Protein kinase domain [Trinorchestia longiramus]|nr:Protein kinase domain [Trinorchestia longiramus]